MKLSEDDYVKVDSFTNIEQKMGDLVFETKVDLRFKKRKHYKKLSSYRIQYLEEELYHHFNIHTLIFLGGARLVKMPKIVDVNESKANCKDYYHVKLLEKILIKNPNLVDMLRFRQKENLRMYATRAHLKEFKHVKKIIVALTKYYDWKI